GTVIPSEGYALVTDGVSGTEVYDSFDVNQDSLALHVDKGSICGGLSNTNFELINLTDGGGNHVDYIAYYGSDSTSGNNLTLIRVEDQLINDSTIHGTPGAEN
ncbi:MAG: hypothetical protein KAU03_03955, partial [Candidatus Altiarchaeales archaeon]|nr:hypothetical protein [Candidatus Altiarchaeales archaeon]